jgi:hypothetical protein
LSPNNALIGTSQNISANTDCTHSDACGIHCEAESSTPYNSLTRNSEVSIIKSYSLYSPSCSTPSANSAESKPEKPASNHAANGQKR